MAEGRTCRINLAALQQRDPYITNILETASQVALYSFSSKANEWAKTDIEGTLFVYTRSAVPINGFTILNRLGLNNQIEPITKDLEFQLQDPFLLYKNSSSIYGIWFYDKDECARIGQLMNSLLQVTLDSDKQETTDPNGRDRHRRASESDTMIDRRLQDSTKGQVDIMQLLSKAQDEYDKVNANYKMKGRPGSPRKYEPRPMVDNPNASASNLVKPTAIKPEQETNGVKNGYSTAAGPVVSGSGTINLETLFGQAQVADTKGPRQSERHRGGGDPGDPVPLSVGNPPANAVLDRLMSNPGNMLEEIERQQRSQIDRKDTPPSPNTDLRMKLNIMAGGGDTELYAKPMKKRQSPKEESNVLSQFFSARSPTGKDNLLTPADLIGPAPMTQSLGSQATILHPVPVSAAILASAPPAASPRKMTSPPTTNVLMSPMAFEKSGSAQVPVMGVLNPSPLPVNPASIPRPDSMLMAFDPIPPVASASSDPPPPYPVLPPRTAPGVRTDINPLTRDQLQQSLLYLIKNDPEFMKKIHEGYVKSLGLS